MAVEFKDYYATLGVPRSASQEEIKRAFRKLARQYHPDVAKDKKIAEQKFKEINEANEVLSDPAKRKRYDELGADWKNGAGFPPPPRGGRSAGRAANDAPDSEFHFGGTGFSDFFEQFFSRGSRFGSGFPSNGDEYFSQRGGPVRGHDIEGDILVTLDEVMDGSLRTLSIQRIDPRTGRATTHTVKVRIPPGVQERQTIRVPAKGEAGSDGGPAGDIYLHVRLAAHPDFQVHGTDLYYELDLAPWEGVLGTNVSVPTLKGHVSVRIPPGTNNGQKLRVRGQGLPRGRNGERGDLYVVINVQLPKQVNDEERELWEKLGRVSRFNPRQGA
jgi:curved DNA-binding protein